MIENSKLPHLHAGNSLAGEQSFDFLLGIVEPRKQLTPDLVESLEPRSQFGAGGEAVVRGHIKMIGTNLPSVFDIRVSRRIDSSVWYRCRGCVRSSPTFF